MPRTCVVWGCDNKQKTGSRLIFHSIPTRTPERMKRWLDALNIHSSTPQGVIKMMLVCSEHFSRDDYYEKLEFKTQTMRLFLKDTATPSVGITLHTPSPEEGLASETSITRTVNEVNSVLFSCVA